MNTVESANEKFEKVGNLKLWGFPDPSLPGPSPFPTRPPRPALAPSDHLCLPPPLLSEDTGVHPSSTHLAPSGIFTFLLAAPTGPTPDPAITLVKVHAYHHVLSDPHLDPAQPGSAGPGPPKTSPCDVPDVSAGGSLPPQPALSSRCASWARSAGKCPPTHHTVNPPSTRGGASALPVGGPRPTRGHSRRATPLAGSSGLLT